ncbi:hypothetical protein V6N12_023995 [Hibiscus sabdariffa]|uniref:Uncharacterized protein n=1 Tax=Hibiscus sabdariffa TaxID=183260 RepID=A0ABR2FZ91_9ROSI
MIERLWEGNKTVDWCVLGTASLMTDEEVGMCLNTQENRMMVTGLVSLVEDGPRPRASKAHAITYKGQLCRVRPISDLIGLSSVDHVTTKHRIVKKERVRPRKSPASHHVCMMEKEWEKLSGLEGDASVVTKLWGLKSILCTWHKSAFGDVDGEFLDVVAKNDELEQ